MEKITEFLAFEILDLILREISNRCDIHYQTSFLLTKAKWRSFSCGVIDLMEKTPSLIECAINCTASSGRKAQTQSKRGNLCVIYAEL